MFQVIHIFPKRYKVSQKQNCTEPKGICSAFLWGLEEFRTLPIVHYLITLLLKTQVFFLEFFFSDVTQLLFILSDSENKTENSLTCDSWNLQNPVMNNNHSSNDSCNIV